MQSTLNSVGEDHSLFNRATRRGAGHSDLTTDASHRSIAMRTHTICKDTVVSYMVLVSRVEQYVVLYGTDYDGSTTMLLFSRSSYLPYLGNYN